MINQFTKYKLNYLRIPAVDSDIPDILEQILIIPKNTNQSEKELCCLLSHFIAIKKAFDDDLQEVLIMEDNVNFEFLIKNINKFKNGIKKIPNDYEIIQLLTINPYAIETFTDNIEKTYID